MLILSGNQADGSRACPNPLYLLDFVHSHAPNPKHPLSDRNRPISIYSPFPTLFAPVPVITLGYRAEQSEPCAVNAELRVRTGSVANLT